MSTQAINIAQHVFKKVKFYKDKSDLFLQVCKAALKRVGKLDNAPDDEWFIERLNDPNYGFLTVDVVVREASGYSAKVAYNSELLVVEGYFLPYHDQIQGMERFLNTELKGVSMPFLTIDGELLNLVRWKKEGNTKNHLQIDEDSKMKYGDQRKIPIPVFHKTKIKIHKSETASKTVKDVTYINYKFEYLISIDKEQMISLEELQKSLISLSKLPKDITKSDQGKLLVLRDITWKSSEGAELWRKSDKRIKIIPSDPSKVRKDGKGNPIFEYKDAPPEQDKIGQGINQVKNGTEDTPTQIITMKINLDATHGDNFINCNLWNNQFGSPLVWIPSFEEVIAHAVSSFGNNKVEDASKSPFTIIDNTLKGSELLVLGKLTNAYRKPEAPDTDPFALTLNIYFLADLRFPFIETEDRRFPVDIREFPQDYPIYAELPKTVMKIGELPKDVDLNYGYSYDQLQQVEQQFQKSIPVVEPESQKVDLPSAPPQQELPFMDEFGKWLDIFNLWWSKLANDYIDENSFSSVWGIELMDILEDTASAQLWRPAAANHLYMISKERKLNADSELYYHWRDNIREQKVIPSISITEKSDSTPDVIHSNVVQEGSEVQHTRVSKDAPDAKFDEPISELDETLNIYNDPDGICTGCQRKRIVSSQTASCQECDVASEHGLQFDLETQKYASVSAEIVPTSESEPSDYNKFISILKALFSEFESNWVANFTDITQELSNYMVKENIAIIVPNPEGGLWLSLKVPMSELHRFLNEFFIYTRKDGKKKVLNIAQKITENLKKDIEVVKNSIEPKTATPDELDQASHLAMSNVTKTKTETDFDVTDEEEEFYTAVYEKLTGYLESYGSYQGFPLNILTDQFTDFLIEKKFLSPAVLHTDGGDVSFLHKIPLIADEKIKINNAFKKYIISNMSKGDSVFFDDPTPTKEDEPKLDPLDVMTVKELRKHAKELGITGYSTLKKDDIIGLINKKHDELILKEEKEKTDKEKTEIKERMDKVLPTETKSKGVDFEKLSKKIKTKEPKVTTGLTPDQQTDLDDLKLSIKDFLKSGMVKNVTFDNLFTNFPGFLSSWVDETHRELINKIIEVCKTELSSEEISG